MLEINYTRLLLKQVVTNILDLADKLKEGTIERVMSKSDFELGLEALKKRNDGS